MAAEPTKAMIANILDCWDAAERELGMNPDAGLELFQQFPRVGDLLEAVRTAALALCESPAAETWQPSGRVKVLVEELLRLTSDSQHAADPNECARCVVVILAKELDLVPAPPTSGAAQETKS